MEINAVYYLDHDRQRQGPVRADELAARGVTPDTLVWMQGMKTWVQAREVPELAPYLASAAPAAPARRRRRRPDKDAKHGAKARGWESQRRVQGRKHLAFGLRRSSRGAVPPRPDYRPADHAYISLVDFSRRKGRDTSFPVNFAVK